MFNNAEINELFVQTRKTFRRSLILPIIVMIFCIIGTGVIGGRPHKELGLEDSYSHWNNGVFDSDVCSQSHRI